MPPETTSSAMAGERVAQSMPAAAGLSPMLPVANAALALAFACLARESLSPAALSLWIAAALTAALLPLPVLWLKRRGKPRDEQRILIAGAGLAGLIWASVPVIFLPGSDAGVKLLAIAATFAVAGMGSLSLSASPRAAITFVSVIAASLILESALMGGSTGLAVAILTALFCGGIIGLVLNMAKAEAQRGAAMAEISKQNEIITLLLDDAGGKAGNWLWETDATGSLVYVSQSFAAACQRAGTSWQGRRVEDVLRPDLADAGWQVFAAALQAGRPAEALVAAHGVEGPLRWRLAAKPILDDKGEFAGHRGAAFDITTEWQAEAQLLKEKEAAEKSSEIKTQFLAVMTHELRTPLNAILGFAEVLSSPRAEVMTSEQKIEHLRTILDSSRHLHDLINDILDATRIERGTLQLAEQECDLAELLEIAVKLCRGAAEKADVTIVARLIDHIEITADVVRIKQVVINLVANAVKFSPPGGIVQLSIERQSDGGLAIAVKDTGIGIRQEDIDRIFQPFVQAETGTARQFGGIGLGLAIAREIAIMHGGTITLESQPGVGTTAKLLLPASRVRWNAASNAA